MRFRIGAAAAVIVGLSSAVALAGNGGIVVGTSPQGGAQIVHVLDTGSMVDLRHDPHTLHTLVDLGAFITPGACRMVAIRWNVAVLDQASFARFKELLRTLAHHHCWINYTPGAASPNGTVDLLAVGPAA